MGKQSAGDVFLWRNHSTNTNPNAGGARGNEYELYVPFENDQGTFRYAVYTFKQYNAGMGMHLGRLREGLPIRNLWHSSLDRQGQWVSHPTVQLPGSGELDLTPNADLVPCAPYATINTAASNIQNGRDYLNDANEYRIRQTGSITQIKLYIDGVPANIIFKVWRLNGGGTFDLVGQSQDFAGSVAGSSLNTIVLNTPIAVQEGDFTGVYVNGGASALTANTGVTGASLRYFTSQASDPADFRGAGAAAASIAVPIECHLQAPSLVHIGDSRVAGHPAHFAYTESTILSDISSTAASQLKSINGFSYQNMGVGSQTSGNVDSRFAADVIALKPKAVVIEVGVNDVSVGVSQATFIANYTSILDQCAAEGITPIIVKITPWHGSTNTQAQTLDDFNDALVSLAAAYPDAIVVDAAPQLGEERIGGSPTPPPGNLWNGAAVYRADTVHWNADGNGVIAAAIQNAVDGSSSVFDDPAGDYPTPTGTILRSKSEGDTISGIVSGHTLFLRTAIQADHGIAFVSIDSNGRLATLLPEVTGADFRAITGVQNNGSGECRVTSLNHGFSDGATIDVEGVVGVSGANGRFTITLIDGDTFDLQESSFVGAYSTGGTAGFFKQVDRGKRYANLYATISGQFDEHIPIAEGLEDTDHEIGVTVVGTAQAGGSDGKWVGIHGFAGASTGTLLSDQNASMGYRRDISNLRNRAEFPATASQVAYTPDGFAENYQSIGETGGNERLKSLTWKVNQVIVSPGPNDLLTGREITLDEVVDLLHPDTGTTAVATRNYRFIAKAGRYAGLTCVHDTLWKQPGICDRIDVAMLQVGVRDGASSNVVQEVFDSALISTEFLSGEATTVLDRLDKDNDESLGKVQGDTVTWTSRNHSTRAFVTLPQANIALNNFAKSEPLFVHVVDRGDGADQAHFTRTTPVYPESVTGGDLHTSEIGWHVHRYREAQGPFVVEAVRIVSALDQAGRFVLESVPEIEAAVPAGTSPTMLARIIDSSRSGLPLDPLSIHFARYSFFMLDEDDPQSQVAVTGHADSRVEPCQILFTSLQRDFLWEGQDERGYNFQFRPATQNGQPLPERRRYYRAKIELVPWSGTSFQIRYRFRTV